jgi:hypothetical protein
VAGACALLLAPMQFSDWLRQRFTKMHRIVGRIYIAGVFVLAPLGAYIQYLEERLGVPRTFTIATAVDAILLISTTAIALFFILNRRIQMPSARPSSGSVWQSRYRWPTSSCRSRNPRAPARRPRLGISTLSGDRALDTFHSLEQ